MARTTGCFIRGAVVLAAICVAAIPSGGVARVEPQSLHMGRVLENERMIRRALGIDPFLPGSIGDIIDRSLYPRPQRLARQKSDEFHERTMRRRGKLKNKHGSRYVTASEAASRHHVRTPVNVMAVENGSSTFLMVASFYTDYVFKYNLAEGLGHPETFASHVSCDLDGESPCVELSGPWGMAVRDNEFFVASFGTDRIIIIDLTTSKVLGEMGSSEELNGPEDLAMGPDGTFLYVSNYLGGDIARFNGATRQFDRVFAFGLSGPEGLELIQSGILASACNTDHSIRFFNISNGFEIAAFFGKDTPSGMFMTPHSENLTHENALASGPGRSHLKLVESNVTLEKPVDVLWVGGNRVLVTYASSIASFILDVEHAAVHFEGFASVSGSEQLKSKHPSGMSALLSNLNNPVIFVAAYDTQRVLIFELDPEADSEMHLEKVATGRL